MVKKNVLLCFVIFLTCFVIYLIGWSGYFYSIDGMMMFQFAKQISFEHSFKFSPPMVWGESIIPTSKWALGLTFLYIPLLLIGSVISENPTVFQSIPTPGTENFYELMFFDPGYRWISLIHLFVVAASAACVFLLTVQLKFKQKQAVAAALIFGLLSPAAVYSRLDYAQSLAGLFLILCFIFFVQGLKKNSLSHFFLSSLMISAACLTRVEFFGLIASLPLFFLFFCRPKGWRKKIGMYLIPLGLTTILQLWLNHLRFDHFFQFGYEPGSEFNLETVAVLQAFLSLLIHPTRGLWVYFPISLFALKNISLIRKKQNVIYWVFLWLLLFPLLFYAGWRDWHAGYTWGPRFLIPFLPFWTIAAVNIIFPLNRKKTIFFIIVSVFSGLTTLQGFLFDRLNGAKSLFEIKSLDSFIKSFPYFYQPQDVFNLTNYNSFWIKQLQIGWGERSLLFVLILLISSMAVLGWVYWFVKHGQLEKQLNFQLKE